jgi:outer membrane protein, adhesin transport system
MRSILLSVALVSCVSAPAKAAEIFTIHQAIEQAIQTHPGVGEASANRRATESELRQTQGTLLPQVRLDANAIQNKLDQRNILPVPTNNDKWVYGREGSITVRQLLFDGFASINDVWRQTARVDASAHRVLERTELIALDAVEAYIDVVRYLQIVSIAQANVAAHRRIQGNVEQRFSGGRSGDGDLQQALERTAGAEAALAEFRRSLDDARAKYRRAVGLEPYNLRFPGRLRGMPASKDDSLAVALRFNPTIRAAQSDADAARYGFRATAGAFVPNVSLEGRATRGEDTPSFPGKREELTGKVIMSWDVFRGGQDMWKRNEAAERMIEQNMRHARLQREAFESLDKAWGARTITSDRIAALTRQVQSAVKVVEVYGKEYEIGQRTLINLLDSENQLFSARVSLISARGVSVFADYQLLAAMGQLLEYLKTAPPPEAETLAAGLFGLVPYKLPPVHFRDPGPGPEPLNVQGPYEKRSETGPVDGPALMRLSDRWPNWSNSPDLAMKSALNAAMPKPGVLASTRPRGTFDSRWVDPALGFAPDVSNIVTWPITPAQQ